MQIKEGYEIIDLGLLVGDTLIFTDFHIGYEEALNKRGVLIPRFQFKDTMKRLDLIFNQIETSKVRINKIVINGDLKHEYGSISETEWRHILILIDYLRKKCNELIVIKGNHDVLLKPIVEKRQIQLADYFLARDAIVLHGDKIPNKKDDDIYSAFRKAKTIIIGNEHPAVGLREKEGGVRKEKFKCFLYGKYKSKDLIVIPSFNLVTEGTDVISEKLLSPFLKQDIAKFKVWIVADYVYYFGELGKL